MWNLASSLSLSSFSYFDALKSDLFVLKIGWLKKLLVKQTNVKLNK